MKFGIASALTVAVAIAKVNAACWANSLGYNCCSPNNKVVVQEDANGKWGIENNDWCGMNENGWTGQDQGYPGCGTCTVTLTDSDGAWGFENGVWCGIKASCSEQKTTAKQLPTQALTQQWAGQNQGFPGCSGCVVAYTDEQGPWGNENGVWCGIRVNKCNSTPQQPPVVQPPVVQPPVVQPPAVTTTTTTTEAPKPTEVTLPPVSGGRTGKTTRYWDCCVASCAWSENTNADHPVNVCQKDGKTVYPKFDWTIGNVCDGGKQGYMCSNNQPWAVNEKLAYGFAAASLSGQGTQKDWCCSCQRLEFTSGPVKGKQMVVQVTNTGGDLGENHFDIQMPGGGLGIFDGCSPQWGNASSWGERYGGLRDASGCSNLPADLQAGCKWRFDWFQNADNPSVTFERVQCPKELTDITGCIPRDDASQKKLPW